MTEDPASTDLEFEVEVSGRPEDVWRAVATGPGISSWYVPHVVVERAGGRATASFGAAPEMQVEGRVAAWEPPHRVVFDGGDDDEVGLVFEWLVEPAADTTCIVRLVNTGFGSDEESEAHRDAMAQGWLLFLENLRLHLEHFVGRIATAALPMAMWAGPRAETWARLADALGVDPEPEVGQKVEVADAGAPSLAGTVVDVAPWRLALLLDEPTPGTAFLAVEGDGDQVGVSIWSYLYGTDGAEAAARDEPRWQQWLDDRGLAAP